MICYICGETELYSDNGFMQENRGNILMYQTVDGNTAIEVVLSDDTVWLTIDKMAELFQRNKSTSI